MELNNIQVIGVVGTTGFGAITYGLVALRKEDRTGGMPNDSGLRVHRVFSPNSRKERSEWRFLDNGDSLPLSVQLAHAQKVSEEFGVFEDDEEEELDYGYV